MELKQVLIFPNPVISYRFYLLSQITTDGKYELRLLDLNGHIIKQTIFTPQQAMQYVIDIPRKISLREYIINIKGKDNNFSEKLIIR